MATKDILTQPTGESQPAPATPEEEIKFLTRKWIPFLKDQLAQAQQKAKALAAAL